MRDGKVIASAEANGSQDALVEVLQSSLLKGYSLEGYHLYTSSEPSEEQMELIRRAKFSKLFFLSMPDEDKTLSLDEFKS